jgi:putative mRNA 3-end processing factor
MFEGRTSVIPQRQKKRRRQAQRDFPIDVVGSGAVLLGPKVTCDGFHADRAIRVQTHIHSDHMEEFTTSLRGDVVMTKATRRLLHLEHPALEERSNVRVLDYAEEWEYEGHRIQLLSSDHALGAAQVKVTMADGTTLGYSGDFNWPLEHVIKVDALVVDATYGNPSSRNRCSQEKVQEALVDLVRKKLRSGPIHLMADTGPLERALLTLEMSDALDGVPVIGNKRVCWYADVHREFRRPIPVILTDDCSEARAAMRAGPYIRLWSLHSRLPNDGLYEGTVICLTKFRTSMEPIEKTGEDIFHVGFSNHADFAGTLEYVQATGASFVVTDNHRGQTNNRHLPSMRDGAATRLPRS